MPLCDRQLQFFSYLHYFPVHIELTIVEIMSRLGLYCSSIISIGCYLWSAIILERYFRLINKCYFRLIFCERFLTWTWCHKLLHLHKARLLRGGVQKPSLQSRSRNQWKPNKWEDLSSVHCYKSGSRAKLRNSARFSKWFQSFMCFEAQMSID